MDIQAIFRVKNRSDSGGSCALCGRENIPCCFGVRTVSNFASIPHFSVPATTIYLKPLKTNHRNGSHQGVLSPFLSFLCLSSCLPHLVSQQTARKSTGGSFFFFAFPFQLLTCSLQVKLPVSNSQPRLPGRLPK